MASDSERFSPWSGADPCADLSADPVANPSATYRSQRNGFAAMPLDKRHCGAFGASGCEPQCEVQCELQNEVQCEARAKRSKTVLECRFVPVNVLSDNAKWGGAGGTARPRLKRYKLMSISQDTSAPEAGPDCGDKRRLKKTKTPASSSALTVQGRRSVTSPSSAAPGGSESATHAPTTRRSGSSARARPTATAASCRSARPLASSATSMNGSSATAAREGAVSARAPARNTAA
jgi:hypothetical protein